MSTADPLSKEEAQALIADKIRDEAYSLAARADDLAADAVTGQPVLSPAVSSAYRVMRAHLEAARRSLHLAAGAAESAVAIAAAVTPKEEETS